MSSYPKKRLQHGCLFIKLFFRTLPSAVFDIPTWKDGTHTQNCTFAYGYRACAIVQKPERRQLSWQETDRVQRTHTNDAHRRCGPPHGGMRSSFLLLLTIFKWGSTYIFNMSCSLLAQSIIAPPFLYPPNMKEISTVEEKGHDVDSTTYLHYIQNKALFSADKLECSAAFVWPSDILVELPPWQLYSNRRSFHQKKTKTYVRFSNCLHIHTHSSSLLTFLALWTSWLLYSKLILVIKKF